MDTHISIITVCLNSHRTIHDTIRSILEQDFTGYEYIVIDGGSTDGTLDVIESYFPHFVERGVRYRWVSGRDRGMYDAMNKGIGLASGTLVGILNADDWYEPDTLRTVFDAYTALPDGDSIVIYGMLRLWREGQEYALRRYHHHFVRERVIQHPTCFVPRSLYERYGGFDIRYRLAGDFELLNRLHSRGVGFHGMDRVLTNFRLGGASASTGSRGTLETLRVMKDYGTIGLRSYYLRAWKARLGGAVRCTFRLNEL
ncbi:glycosyltransferase family 2 protein [Parapedobacter sp. DT-150]|uniref:glycosyltransferase family 2 protein n=1 Tax=Parapedobacter sp. DT-150 TaxID=3396162 RepID=UPI003F1E3A20